MVMKYSVASINPLVISHHYGKWPKWPNPVDFSTVSMVDLSSLCQRFPRSPASATPQRGQVIRAEELLEQLSASTEQLNPEKVRPGDGGMMEG